MLSTDAVAADAPSRSSFTALSRRQRRLAPTPVGVSPAMEARPGDAEASEGPTNVSANLRMPSASVGLANRIRV
jgi:hypothetical protein